MPRLVRESEDWEPVIIAVGTHEQLVETLESQVVNCEDSSPEDTFEWNEDKTILTCSIDGEKVLYHIEDTQKEDVQKHGVKMHHR